MRNAVKCEISITFDDFDQLRADALEDLEKGSKGVLAFVVLSCMPYMAMCNQHAINFKKALHTYADSL